MRAAYQVLIIPYQKFDGEYKFAIFNRADMDCWQWISGGGEDFDANILASAKRESYEEAGILQHSEFMQLDTKTSIPASIFGDFLWGEDVYVITEHCFGVKINNKELQLSDEHQAYQWVSYVDAMQLLKYDSNRTALWELVTRLERQ